MLSSRYRQGWRRSEPWKRRTSVLSSINRSGLGELILAFNGSMRLILVARRNPFFVGAQKSIEVSETSVPPQMAGEINASLEHLRLALALATALLRAGRLKKTATILESPLRPTQLSV